MLLANTAVANIRSVSVLRGLTTSAGDRPGEASSEHDVAGTLAVATDGHDVQQTGLEAPPPPQSTRKPRRRHLVLDVSIIVGVGAVCFPRCSATTGWPPHRVRSPSRTVGTADGTVVLARLEQLHPVEHRLDVKVLVMPDNSMIDKRLNVLTTERPCVSFRTTTWEICPIGKSPAQVATNIEAHGDPGDWPFDTYKTDTIQADVLVGVGDDRQYKPARVEVTGLLEGWDVTVTRVGPTLALFVAIQILTSRRQFLPPFSTWYAPMLFAVVPLRNILPGTPPAGAWIEQAVVIWVLIALATALVLYIMAWYRHPS